MMPAARYGDVNKSQANIIEIMESIQGEGLLIGSPQVFVRFSGCNMRCSYCDTPGSFTPSINCAVYPNIGISSNSIDVPNPITPQKLSELIHSNYKSRWISFTGGEPLLNAHFIRETAFIMRSMGYKFLLETNGTLPDALCACLPQMDLISMDWKMKYDVGIDTNDVHNQFLRLAYEKNCYVKIVVTGFTSESEVLGAFENIAKIDRKIPVILQFVSPGPKCTETSNEKMLKLLSLGQDVLEDIRILPQLHRMLGLL